MTAASPRPPAPRSPEQDPAAYDYILPENRIASHPARPRDSARLLVLRRGTGAIEHTGVRDLPEILDPGDLLVVNETRVLPARVHGWIERRRTEVEILLIRETRPREWLAWVRGARNLRPGDAIRFEGQATSAQVGPRDGESVRLLFEGDVTALLGQVGHMPLPPYIRREDSLTDREDYQTIFARVPGAVAAPTAGLHFTPDLTVRLQARGIGIARVLLHVGPGTFRPVRVADLREHRVERESFAVGEETASALAQTRASGRRVVAVGTTTVRCLETASVDGGSAEGWTDLTIVPPYRFRAIDALMTNFHLPRSSLLLLVSAFGGRERILAAYEEAIREGYRFYSYGDAMLIL